MRLVDGKAVGSSPIVWSSDDGARGGAYAPQGSGAAGA